MLAQDRYVGLHPLMVWQCLGMMSSDKVIVPSGGRGFPLPGRRAHTIASCMGGANEHDGLAGAAGRLRSQRL